MKFVRLLLSFLFLMPLAIPMAVHALQSEDVVIMQVQTGGAGSGTATEEYVLLYNTSTEDIQVSDWCIAYSSAGNGETFTSVGCIVPPVMTELWLASGGMVSFATEQFSTAHSGFAADVVMSGGFAAAGGHVRLVDADGMEVDRIGWGTAVAPEGSAAAEPHMSGEVLSRDASDDVFDSDDNAADTISIAILSPITSGLYEQDIIIDLCHNIDGVQAELPEGFLADELGDCYVDMCPNLKDLQTEIPEGFEMVDGTAECTEIPVVLEDAPLLITELLPNAPSFDTGQEFIELFNPNDQEVALAGYELQLGPSYQKTFTIGDGVILPGSYQTFSDTISGLTLPNSSASLRLLAPFGNIVSETAAYNTPKDDVSWALVEDTWIFTNQITPGEANKPYLEPAVDEVIGVTTVFAPCPVGKFRNPATNRCKNIETAVSQLTPCDEDEFRNPETNRCKKLTTASTTSSLVPCKEGQFRNPETNRCKSIESAESELKPCDEGEERNPETNRCRKVAVLGSSSGGGLPSVTDIQVQNTAGQLNWPVVAAAVAATVGYMAFEWRAELRQKLLYLRINRSRQ